MQEYVPTQIFIFTVYINFIFKGFKLLKHAT
jgi:hypothetical protein